METDAGAGNTLYVSGQDTELAHKSQEWGHDFDMVKAIFLPTTVVFLHSDQPFHIKRVWTFPLFGSGISIGMARF
ncbi:MAG: hypothetical protein CMM05_00285 [Rhodopirellula sp.]|nr:hypothetical protein [Rhodopirellula sp.]